MKSRAVKKGDTVEYACVAGTIHVKVLEIKPDGNLILSTREENRLVKSALRHKKVGDKVSLSKNVCVRPHRVKQLA